FKAACLHVLDIHSDQPRRGSEQPRVATGASLSGGRKGPVPLSNGMKLYQQAKGVRPNTAMDWDTEPPRVCRRLFGLSHAAMVGSSSMA
ncbi:MAG: hypothetical protein RIB31_02155, partial [Thalassobaculaceae bacterium]